MLKTSAARDSLTFDAIRMQFGFLTFSSFLSRRITGGKSRKAYVMLTSIGMESIWAWRTINGMPEERSNRAKRLGYPLSVQQAIYLAQMLESTVCPSGIAYYDWLETLTATLEAAEEYPLSDPEEENLELLEDLEDRGDPWTPKS